MIVLCLLVGLFVSVVTGWYAYWIGRERGYLDGVDEGLRAVPEMTSKKRELIREVLRTGDAHYTDGDGVVRRVEKKDSEK